MELTERFTERFWSHVKFAGIDQCWEWKMARFHFGHGVVSVPYGHKQDRSHRVAWVIANGRPIPDGMCVLHHCDNPPCCNPAHLFIGTKADNSTDRNRKTRQAAGNAITANRRPMKGADNGRAKLTEQHVAEMRSRYDSSLHSVSAIARSFGVSASSAHRIVNRMSWRHISNV